MWGVFPGGQGKVQLGKELGRGGEGSVFEVVSHTLPNLLPASRLVAKVYHEPEAGNRRAKLKAMLQAPVEDPAVAWPLALLFDDTKAFQGYLMVKLDSSSYRELLYVANAQDRRKVAPAFDTRYALVAARNMAAAILAVHAQGHRIGDINESNIFLGADATVLVVDTDSMQITSPTGEVYPCPVGKPEYTAPELTYSSLRDSHRTEATDIFAFAVAVYQLLTGGATPHQGAFNPNSEDDPPSTVERIRRGVLPSLKPQEAKSYGFSPRPGVPVSAFPPFLSSYLIAFLSPEPNLRSVPEHNLTSLIKALDSYVPTLVRCSRERLHWHEADKACPWCAAATGGVDPWASSSPQGTPAQTALPAIDFQNAQAASAQRSAPAVAGLQTVVAQAAATYGVPNLPQTVYVPSAAPQPQAPQPTHPKKIKGRVVLDYVDGTWGVRPALGTLMKNDPKTALWAMREETPGVLHFWWDTARPLASKPGLWLGLASGFLLSGIWFYGTFLLFSAIPFMASLSPSVLILLSFLPSITSLLACLSLLGSAFRDRARTRKRHGSLNGFKTDNWQTTLFRFLPLIFFYGLPFVLGLAFLLIVGLFNFLRAVAKA